MNPPRPATSAEALVPAVLAGDPAALDAWYRAEHPRVWRLCTGLLASREEAEDAVQDALMQLSDRLDRWEPARPYAAWSGRVVVNLCRDRLRRLEARRRAESAAGREVLAQAAAQPFAAGGDPAAAAAREDTARLLERALRSLAPREREAFVLTDLEGGATRDTAEAMGIASGTVRTLLAMARRRLREQLAPHLDPGEAGASR